MSRGRSGREYYGGEGDDCGLEVLLGAITAHTFLEEEGALHLSGQQEGTWLWSGS